jgi:hypothetical protein
MATVITNLLSAIPIFGQDLVQSKIFYSISLITIGKISPHAYKKGRKKLINKEEYSNIPYSFLSMLIGLIDGDGYLAINKSSKGYISITLTLGFNIRDLSLLKYIQSILKIGKISILKNKNECRLVINRTDLQEILFPLFNYHKLYFLTETRRRQYDKIIYILENNIKLFKDIPINIPILNTLPNNPINYTQLPFFNN